MEIENIIYQTTRNIYSIEDKLSIATVFIFCWRWNAKAFSELLYTADHEAFIERLNQEYSSYDVDFSIRLSDKNVRECFYATLKEVKVKYDSDGFYKALFEGDEYALVIENILNYNFKQMNHEVQ